MEDYIRKHTEGKVAILDSCFFTPRKGVPSLFTKRSRSLHEISTDLLDGRIKRIDSLRELASLDNVVVTPAVFHELKTALNSVYDKLNHYKGFSGLGKNKGRRYATKLAKINDYAEALHGLISSLDHRSHRIGFDYPDDMNIRELGELLEKENEGTLKAFQGKGGSAYFAENLAAKGHLLDLGGRDFKGKFKLWFEDYMAFLKMAINYSKDLRTSSLKVAFRDHKSCLGAILNTDARIAAAAFAFSYHTPAVIFSRDGGIASIVDRIYERINESGVQEKFKLRDLPEEQVTVRNPTYDAKIDSKVAEFFEEPFDVVESTDYAMAAA